LIQDGPRRARLSTNAMELVDGRGADRVVREMRIGRLRLRDAQPGDMEQLFRWVNDPAVRSAAFHPEPISRETHENWFNSCLASPDVKIYMARGRGNRPLGQIRFNSQGHQAMVDYSLASRVRGLGLARPLIRAGIARLKQDCPHLTTLTAQVKRENAISNAVFKGLGFQLKCQRPFFQWESPL
ncbi:MAG: GNAT family N-acetyltransferase, partial [Desulfobacterales bacterium]|nr:GNAT family N-acetyltransferase [Desulfobacterales bacterium]